MRASCSASRNEQGDRDRRDRDPPHSRRQDRRALIGRRRRARVAAGRRASGGTAQLARLRAGRLASGVRQPRDAPDLNLPWAMYPELTTKVSVYADLLQPRSRVDGLLSTSWVARTVMTTLPRARPSLR